MLLVPVAPALADPSDASAGLVLMPAALSVTKGDAVSLTVQLAAVAGPQQIAYVVVGRNDGVHGSVTTDDDGTATIGYRDHGGAGSDSSDTIAVIDAADDESATATVDYLDGPAYAGAVMLDTSGLGVADGSCGGAESAPATAVPLARDTVVCAGISNALGEPLAGKPVMFTVSDGAVGPVDGPGPTAGTTYQSTADRAGIAFATVTATKPGEQQVTTTADHLSDAGSIGYAPPSPADAAAIAISPTTASLTAGRSQRFIARVVDGYGNPVAGVAVGVALGGVGALAASAAPTPVTSAEGTTTAIVTTKRGDHGPGTLTVTILTSPAQCAAGSCSATAAYTVTQPVVPASLAIEAAPGARAGSVELVAAVVSGSDGSPAVGQLVHFAVSGTDAASGTVRTNAKGVGLFGYPTATRGTDTIRAWDDVNRDGRHERTEPVGLLRLAVARRRGAVRTKK
jgi:hypothetical protein